MVSAREDQGDSSMSAYIAASCQIDSHDHSSSAVLEPPCLSSKVTPLVRTKTPCRLLTTLLDSPRSPLRRNHVWKYKSRHQSFHILLQMYYQKYATPLATFTLAHSKICYRTP